MTFDKESIQQILEGTVVNLSHDEQGLTDITIQKSVKGQPRRFHLLPEDGLIVLKDSQGNRVYSEEEILQGNNLISEEDDNQ